MKLQFKIETIITSLQVRLVKDSDGRLKLELLSPGDPEDADDPDLVDVDNDLFRLSESNVM